MKKLIFLFLLLVAGVNQSFAQSADSALSEQCEVAKASCDRKPVTTKWSLLTGPAAYTSHYLNTQEYSGPIKGLSAEHGRFFRKSDRLSWKLTLSHLRSMNRKAWGGGLSNAAETSHISVQSYEVDYAVYYNWLFNDRLQLRLGGSFNIYGGFLFADANAINNVLSVDLQTQFLAAAQVRYGWDFEKWGLDIYANIATPFMGLMTIDERYESFLETVPNSEFNLKEHSHVRFSSLHNMQGVNFEMGVDFALRHLSLSLGYEVRGRWWNAYELQNYRKVSLVKLGVAVNLFTRQNYKSSNRIF